jgi:hypothetical protein
MFPDLDIEKELETLKELYLTLPPGEFVERISQFVTTSSDDDTDSELE